jgi:hypothetical protein
MTSRQERLNGKTENENDFLQELSAPVEVETPVDETPINKGLYFETSEDFDNYFQKLESNQNPLELTGEMLTHKNMEVNKNYNFLWTGYTTISDKVTGEPRRAAMLQNKDRESFICASIVVLSALEKIENVFPIPVRLVSLGMKEGKTNNYWNVKVYAL